MDFPPQHEAGEGFPIDKIDLLVKKISSKI